ncbi:MAG: MgtC/SapB family protein [Bdellovibrionales bacterium]
MIEVSEWIPFALAGLVGLVVGIERERSHPGEKAMGVRTFLLLALLGATARSVEPVWLSVGISALAFGLILISYWSEVHRKRRHEDFGLTTEIAAALVFCLGFAAQDKPVLVGALGPVVALILLSKRYIHKFSHKITVQELQSAALILLLAVTVVNWIGPGAVDPWGLIYPRRFGFIVVTIAALEFSTYLLIRMLGPRKGLVLSGFLGGLVSSTAVVLTASRSSHASQTVSSIAASVASISELLLIAGVLSLSLTPPLVLTVAGPLLIGGGWLVWWSFHPVDGGHVKELDRLHSPLNWAGVLRLSVLLLAILVVIAGISKFLGARATMLVTFLTGLFELHGVTLATSTLHAQGGMESETAVAAISLAMLASLVSKLFIVLSVGSGVYRRRTATALSMMILVGALILAFYHLS